MSIGSSEIVIDGEKAAIDAAPIVQNSRTYVPFRALAEAFGAEVAYDEATQAVTATLGSNTVVMTIGSATYTVNGEEKNCRCGSVYQRRPHHGAGKICSRSLRQQSHPNL